MSVKEIEIPNYNLAQELWNSISHGLGALFAIIMAPFIIIKAAKTGEAINIVAVSIFMFGMLLMFLFSCLYHGLAKNNGKRVLRVMDHNMIYIMIMGTYAPYCLIGLRSYSPAWGWATYGVCVALGILGIVLNSCDIKKFAKFSMINYICMGWLVVISMVPLIKAIGFYPAVFLLLMGGVAYTIGAVLYAIGKKKSPWWHTVFHFFVILGMGLMFVSIYFYVLP
ncbi:MAG: hemolysin III family protein [Bacilli bacterium]|nr:hemolysin III family protein [Bacilli bacterium]